MSLFLNSMESIRSRLNEYLLAQYEQPGDAVVLSNLVDRNGQSESKAADKVCMSVINISHETVISTYQSSKPNQEPGFTRTATPVLVNLHVLFCANFSGDNYAEGLNAISSTISFFQQNPYFTRSTLPELDPQIDKLSFEFTNFDMSELNQVMDMVGSKYLPSVIYKVRVIPFYGNDMTHVSPAVTELGNR